MKVVKMTLNELIVAFGPDAALAASTVLVVGFAASIATRSPANRQRIAELCVAVALLAWMQAFVPIGTASHVKPVVPVVSVESLHTTEGRPVARRAQETRVPANVVATQAIQPTPIPITDHQDNPSADLPTAPNWSWFVLLGAAAVALHGILARLLLAHELSQTTPASTELNQKATRLLGRRIYVRIQSRHMRPFCCGVIRPSIVLPSGLLGQGQEERLQVVLLHELAHLRRRDPAGRALFVFASPFLFWNPLFWWLARDASRCAELVADDAAAQKVGKREYAQALLGLATFKHPRLLIRAGGIHVIRHSGDLSVRIKMLFKRQTPLLARSTRAHLVTRTLAAATLLGGVTMAFGRVPVVQNSYGHETKTFTRITQSNDLGTTRAVEEVLASVNLGLHPWAGTIGGTAVDNATLMEFVFSLAQLGKGKTIGDMDVPTAKADEQKFKLVVSGFTIQEISDCAAGITGLNLQFVKTKPTAKATSKLFDLQAQDIELRELISQIAQVSGANFVVGPEVQGSLTVAFQGVSWREALEASVHTLGFSVIEEGRILRIGVTRNAPSARTPANFYTIAGDVEFSGKQALTEQTNLFEAVVRALPTSSTTLDRIQLIRTHPDSIQVITVDVNKMIAGDTTMNVQLQAGDLIVVPASKTTKSVPPLLEEFRKQGQKSD